MQVAGARNVIQQEVSVAHLPKLAEHATRSFKLAVWKEHPVQLPRKNEATSEKPNHEDVLQLQDGAQD